MKINTNTNKIRLISGDKNISFLSGNKYIQDLNGKTNKNINLSGENEINLLGLKYIDGLLGEKNIEDFNTNKNINLLFGEINKYPLLQGSTELEGYWNIHVDTTYYFTDNIIITVDRN